MTTTRKATTTLEVRLNPDYTVTVSDCIGRSVSFRDITGNDLEYLDTLLGGDEPTLTSRDVINLLGRLSLPPGLNFGRLVPSAIRSLYLSVQTHILKSYMPKEAWLRNCYAVQNGSFANIADMERVPMSKFVAMCQIHKEAMDQMDGKVKNAESFGPAN